MTEQSKHKAYEAGRLAGASGEPLLKFNVSGWGYAKGQYYAWFKMGFYGDKFRSDDTKPEISYADQKARRLIAEEYRRIGRHSKANAVLDSGYNSITLRAFARYIDAIE